MGSPPVPRVRITTSWQISRGHSGAVQPCAPRLRVWLMVLLRMALSGSSSAAATSAAAGLASATGASVPAWIEVANVPVDVDVLVHVAIGVAAVSRTVRLGSGID